MYNNNNNNGSLFIFMFRSFLKKITLYQLD